MRKIAMTVIGLCLAAGSAPAIAKEKLDPRIGAAVACANIAENGQRLRCFDQAIAGLKQALASGQLIPADEARKPLALEGTVRAAGHFGFNRFWIETDSGDRWELEASGRYDVPPKRGAKLTIRRAAIGGYWVKEVGGSNRRANYLGRRN